MALMDRPIEKVSVPYVDLFPFSSFSVQSMDVFGASNLFNTSTEGERGLLTYKNSFQSVSLPNLSFETVPYIEAGWLSRKIINTGYSEWSNLTLSRGFSSPTPGNPIYDLIMRTRFGLFYRSHFIIKIYNQSSIANEHRNKDFSVALSKANVILYCIVKGAVLSDVTMVDSLDSGGSQINVAEMTFEVEDVLYGLYNSEKNERESLYGKYDSSPLSEEFYK